MIQISFNIVVQERRSSRPHRFFSSQPSQRSKGRGGRHKLDRRWTIKPGELPSAGVWQPCSPWSNYVLPHAQFEERQVTLYPPSLIFYALQFHQELDTYLQELETNNAWMHRVTRRYTLIHNLNYWAAFPIDQDGYLSPTFQVTKVLGSHRQGQFCEYEGKI